jgi:hypothetical protein
MGRAATRVLQADNARVSERLHEAARLLHAQGASPYRVHAYDRAAESVRHLPRDLRALFETQGVKGLDAIPGVGLGIASAIAEILETGRWQMLDRLRGHSDPGALLRLIPGVGPALAQRIHDTLHVESLEELEAAARAGRLDDVPGLGERRSAGVRAALEAMLQREPALEPHQLPGAELVLDVDREYRERAAAKSLRTIAPRRFNPEHEAWLPILHTQRGPWHFTAVHSNTALAHKLGRTRDWVVVYFYDGDHVERQQTVVTERAGELAGRRVVRGREDECRTYFEKQREAANES